MTTAYQHLHSSGHPHRVGRRTIGRITRSPVDREIRGDHVAFVTSSSEPGFGDDLEGYAGLVTPAKSMSITSFTGPAVTGVRYLDYLNDGDVVVLTPSGGVSVLFRKQSRHNTILATERCNSLCLMCSQPPREEDDSYRVEEILRLIELMDPECEELGISGGEPTLLGEDLARVIERCDDLLPLTSLHILSNGRRFQDRGYAERIGSIRHVDLMFGIPLYSDIDHLHDHVVQSRGAFHETMEGLYNLARAGVAVEIRVVVHAQTYQRLPQLAEFVYRNCPFAAHVTFMGMEMFGFVHQNFDQLWIDPVDYARRLEEAVLCLALRGMNVSVYNHQLCTIPRSLWPFARKSISDWKKVFLEECDACSVREYCAGFFGLAPISWTPRLGDATG